MSKTNMKAKPKKPKPKIYKGKDVIIYKKIGLSPVELDLIKSDKWDAKKICEIYGMPAELLGMNDKTYKL